MNSMVDEREIRSLLMKLIKQINAILESTDIPLEIYRKRKFHDFEYSETGIGKIGFEYEYYEKPSLSNAMFLVIRKIESNIEYQRIIEICKEQGKSTIMGQKFIKKIIQGFIEGKNTKHNKKNIGAFLKDLRGEPVNSSAVVSISGITIIPKEIAINQFIKLKKPQKEDFETEKAIFSEFEIESDPLSHTCRPTLFLLIEMPATEPTEFFKCISKAITILRLYKRGSVKYCNYTLSTDSFNNPIEGHYSPIYTGDVIDSYILTEADAKKLKNFWKWISPSIMDIIKPEDSLKSNNVSIAFSRYSDSVMNNGMSERRIANAIMGLESLFLQDTERNELSYRLSLRSSKLLSNFLFEPKNVEHDIKNAYQIRSIFLHGGQLSIKKKNQLNEEYDGSLLNFIRQIQDYLRISIIFSLTCQIKKNTLLGLIDSSFITGQTDNRISKKVQEMSKKLF